MGTEKTCQHCGKPIDLQAVGGLCPECMLKVGLGSGLSGQKSSTGPLDPPDLAQIAAKFPQLEVLELLGKGGMGAVYKARQRSLDRLVALKILPPQTGSDPGFAERFTREARALAKLGHPNIVAVHEFGQIDGLHYFIMEYVDGASLRQIEQSGKLTARQALEIIPQICEALQFAHDEGVVHRDIKPENVLLDKKGRVKIADFGLAKILGRDPQELRLTGVKDVMGTPHYMAPEQIERPAEVDHRADIYSLGVVFYEMLTGELPLGKFAPPSRKVQVDVRLDEVVLHALEKEPELRYQQASQVKTDVEQIAVPHQAAATAAPKAPALARPLPIERAVRLAGIAFAIVFALAALVTALMPREYEAVARVIVRDPKVEMARNDAELDWLLRETAWTLRSPAVMRQVASELDLRARWANRFDSTALSEEKLVALLGRLLTIERTPRTAVFSIRSLNKDPAEAVELANKTAEIFCSGAFPQKGEFIDRAVLPLRPARPNVLLNLTLGMLFGVGIALFAGLAGWTRNFIQQRSGTGPTGPVGFYGQSTQPSRSERHKAGSTTWAARPVALAGLLFVLLSISIAAVKLASPAKPGPVNQKAVSGPNLEAAAPKAALHPPPVVIATVPQSGSSEVDPSLTELRATFSTAMQDGSWSWVMLDQEHFPQLTGPPRLLDDGRTCLVPVKLEPGKLYAIWLNSENFQGFRDRTGHSAVPYLLIFQTRK